MISFLVAILLFARPEQGQIEITADKQERDQNIFRYTGSVVATYQDMRVEADAITYDEARKEITEGDHIRFTRGEERLEADHITLNVETKAGILRNAKGELGPGLFITAAEAERTEDGRYNLKNATVTTCDGPRAGWTLALARAVIDTNKHLTARNSIFRLQSVPLMYLPYVVVPTSDRARSTGFLIPSTSSSTTKGRGLREEFFWAIDRSTDAMFTGEYFSKRGPAGAVRLRAIPDASSTIDLNWLFAIDRTGQACIPLAASLCKNNRLYAGGQSLRILTFGQFGRGFRGVADMNLVSSLPFRQVYEEGFNVISSPLEHSLAFLTRNDPGVSVNMLYGRTGIFFKRTDQPEVTLRKFPALEASVAEQPLGTLPLYWSLDTGLAGIARRDASIKTPIFVERYDLHPAFEFPVLRSNALDWSQRLGFRETIYTHSLQAQVVSDPLNRFAFEYASSFAGPQFERDFGVWKHVIEPTIDYRYLTGADRFRKTFVVDDVDLVTNTNEVEYGLTNRFFTTRELFSWRLSQKYFFDPTFGGAIIAGQRNVFAPVLDISGFVFADGPRRFSPIVSTMRLSTSASTSTDLQVDYDTRDHLFRSAGVNGGVNRGQFSGGVSYFFTRRLQGQEGAIQIPNNQLRGTLVYGNEQKPGLSAAFSFSYDVEHSLFQGSVAQFGYNTHCYGLSFELSQFNIGDRKESRFRFAFSLKNIGSYGTLRRQERLF